MDAEHTSQFPGEATETLPLPPAGCAPVKENTGPGSELQTDPS